LNTDKSIASPIALYPLVGKVGYEALAFVGLHRCVPGSGSGVETLLFRIIRAYLGKSGLSVFFRGLSAL